MILKSVKQEVSEWSLYARVLQSQSLIWPLRTKIVNDSRNLVLKKALIFAPINKIQNFLPGIQITFILIITSFEDILSSLTRQVEELPILVVRVS